MEGKFEQTMGEDECGRNMEGERKFLNKFKFKFLSESNRNP